MSRADLLLILKALTLLWPIVEDLVRWMKGETSEPPYLRKLPASLQSRLELERIRAEAKRSKKR